MSEQQKVERREERTRRLERGAGARRALPAIGMEAEFSTVVDESLQRPEDVFGSPRRFIRGPLVHRTGRSYHLPTGGAIYFDTGVMEIATPMIEIERALRALRLSGIRATLDTRIMEAQATQQPFLETFSAILRDVATLEALEASEPAAG